MGKGEPFLKGKSLVTKEKQGLERAKKSGMDYKAAKGQRLATSKTLSKGMKKFSKNLEKDKVKPSINMPKTSKDMPAYMKKSTANEGVVPLTLTVLLEGSISRKKSLRVYAAGNKKNNAKQMKRGNDVYEKLLNKKKFKSDEKNNKGE